MFLPPWAQFVLVLVLVFLLLFVFLLEPLLAVVFVLILLFVHRLCLCLFFCLLEHLASFTRTKVEVQRFSKSPQKLSSL